jgi:cytochrome c551/c552
VIGRADFVFTIGYEGNTAVVDGSLKRKYGRFSTGELAAEGLFKQALCSAIHEQTAKAGGADAGPALESILQAYNAQAEHKLASVEELKRIFGVFEVPAGIARVLVI